MPVTINGTTGITAPAIDAAVDAADITSGTVATARLGSGTANNTTFLRGDQTWATVSLPGTGLGDVGSYAVLMTTTNTTVAMGGTVAGSSLRYNYTMSGGNLLSDSLVGLSNSSFAGYRVNSTASYNGGGTALSGTWRKVGGDRTYFTTCSASHYWMPALYVRIS